MFNQNFERKAVEKTKLRERVRHTYAKNIRIKNSRNTHNIEKYEKRNIRARNLREKYRNHFIRAFLNIKNAFENKDDGYADFLETYSDYYVSAYNRILPYNHGISRKANLLELDKAYKFVANNMLYKYIKRMVKIYRKNSGNEYKSEILLSNHPFDGIRILDCKYRPSYKRLHVNFSYMALKASDYAKSFGANHKSTADKIFFSEYISAAYPSSSHCEDMNYISLKSIVTLCVNKNTPIEKKPKPAFLFLSTLPIGFGKHIIESEADGVFDEQITQDPYDLLPEPDNLPTTHGSFLGIFNNLYIKTAVSLAAGVLLLLFLNSSVVNIPNPFRQTNGSPQNTGAANPENGGGAENGNDDTGFDFGRDFDLSFLPFGLGDKIDDGLNALAQKAAANSNNTASGGAVANAGGNGGEGAPSGTGGSGSTPNGTGGAQGGSGNTPNGTGGAQGGSGNTPNGTGGAQGDSGSTPNGAADSASNTGSAPSGAGASPSSTGAGSSPSGTGDSGSGTGSSPSGTGGSGSNTGSAPNNAESVPSSTQSSPSNTESSPNSTSDSGSGVGSMQSTPNSTKNSSNGTANTQENNPQQDNSQNNTPDKAPSNTAPQQSMPTDTVASEKLPQENMPPNAAGNNPASAPNSEPTENGKENSPAPSVNENPNPVADYALISPVPNNRNTQLINALPGSVDRNGNFKKNPKTSADD